MREVTYDGTYEDLFFFIERLIEQAAGEDVGGRLHTARSRNDIAMTMYRIWQREFIAAVATGAIELRAALHRPGRRAIARRSTARTPTRSRPSRRRSRTTCWR